MPFKEPSLSLRDIAEAIVAIKEFTVDTDAGTFPWDSKTLAAVERKLKVISEAAIRLGDQADVLCPRPSVARRPWDWQLASPSI